MAIIYSHHGVIKIDGKEIPIHRGNFEFTDDMGVIPIKHQNMSVSFEVVLKDVKKILKFFGVSNEVFIPSRKFKPRSRYHV